MSQNNLLGGYEVTNTVYTFTDNPATVTHTHTAIKKPTRTSNISSLTWKSGSESTVHGYKFTYDGLNRIQNAMYGETANLNANANRFSENVTGYDRNGNIRSLQRFGQTGANSYGLIDNLTFHLDGNRLNRVDDAVTTSAYNGGFEFKDGAKQAGEYAYDANGNLTKDLNKKITAIQYNCLNLPSTVTFSDGGAISYTYAADGTKLRTVHKTGGAAVTTDYCGSVIYENGTQKLLLTEEGYVTLADGKYHYYLKDHQGNNRVVIDPSGTVEEVNHYYPFGGTFAGTNSIQPYKYNGKELDARKGLNWYDYGARHYDAALGRFTTVDPLAEKYYGMSLYEYVGNNPVRYIDPTGMIWEDPQEAERLKRNIDNRITSLNKDIAKNQDKLDKGGLSVKQVSKLESKILEANNRISNLNASKADIDVLGADQNNVYVLSSISGGEHKVRQSSDGKVYIETSSDALSIHEITHVRQSLDAGGLKFSTNGELLNAGVGIKGVAKMEIEAYKMQYSYDRSFPGSLGGRGLQGIDVHSVGGIINDGKHVYPVIYQYSFDLNKFFKQQKKLIRGGK